MPIDSFDGMSRSQIMKVCDTVGAMARKAALDPANTDPDAVVHVMDLICQALLDLNKVATALDAIERRMSAGQQQPHH